MRRLLLLCFGIILQANALNLDAESSMQNISLEPKALDSASTSDSESLLDSMVYKIKQAIKPPMLFGDILHPYFGIGYVSGSGNATQGTQSMSKEVATCPSQLCSGDTTSARYEGKLGSGYNLEFGMEYFFDKYHIIGIRVFGEVSQISGSLGERQGGSARDTSTNNLQEAYNICMTTRTDTSINCGILIMGSSTNPDTPNTKVEDTFTFQQTPDMAGALATDGKWLSFAIGADGIFNVPVDYLFKRYLNIGDGFWARRLVYLKVGVFAGGGVEFGRFVQGDNNNKTWKNTALANAGVSSVDDAFFSAGSGGFFRYGFSVNLTRFVRLNFGFKHTFYDIAQERWYAYNGATYDSNSSNGVGEVRDNDPWSETLLRQRFVTSKGKEWFSSLVISF